MEEQEKQVAVRAPAEVSIVNGAFDPKNIDQLWRLAVIVAKSGICPDEFKGDPEKTFVAMAYGMEIGLSPMTCLASMYVINNRPTIFGDMPLALCMRDGGIEEMEETFRGKPYDDDFTAVCSVRAKGSKFTVVREFSVSDARTAGLWQKKGKFGGPTPWITHPKRMLQFKARTFALRDACPGALRGIPIYEELAYQDEVINSSENETVTVKVPVSVTPEVHPSDKMEMQNVMSLIGDKTPEEQIPNKPISDDEIYQNIVEENGYNIKDCDALLETIMKNQKASREEVLRTIAEDPSRFIRYANNVFSKKRKPERKEGPQPEKEPESKDDRPVEQESLQLTPDEASWRDRLAALRVKFPEVFEIVRKANGFASTMPTEEGARVFVSRIHEYLDNPKLKKGKK